MMDLQKGFIYLCLDSCVQHGKYAACTDLMMENLIIIAIFILDKYSFASAALDPSIALQRDVCPGKKDLLSGC